MHFVDDHIPIEFRLRKVGLRGLFVNSLTCTPEGIFKKGVIVSSPNSVNRKFGDKFMAIAKLLLPW